MKSTKGVPADVLAKDLKGHGILAVQRFHDSTRWMIEFKVLAGGTVYGNPGDEVRLFLSDCDFQAALQAQRDGHITIKRYARLIEGHILGFRHKKRRRH